MPSETAKPGNNKCHCFQGLTQELLTMQHCTDSLYSTKTKEPMGQRKSLPVITRYQSNWKIKLIIYTQIFLPSIPHFNFAIQWPQSFFSQEKLSNNWTNHLVSLLPAYKKLQQVKSQCEAPGKMYFQWDRRQSCQACALDTWIFCKRFVCLLQNYGNLERKWQSRHRIPISRRKYCLQRPKRANVCSYAEGEKRCMFLLKIFSTNGRPGIVALGTCSYRNWKKKDSIENNSISTSFGKKFITR